MQRRYKICFAVAVILFFIVGPANNTLSSLTQPQGHISNDHNPDDGRTAPIQLFSGSIHKDNTQKNKHDTRSVVKENTREELPKIGSINRTLEIAPGQRYYAYLDFDVGALVEKHIPDNTISLPESVKIALAAVPEWLREDLEYTFTTLSSSDSTTYAQEIINAADPRYVDEIAFCIAHSHRGLLERLIETNETELFAKNAEDIYTMSGRGLNYSELVEKTDHTTIIYKSGFGGSQELEKDMYYWYVVYPRTHIELPHFVDVEGTPRFWRSYFPDNTDHGTSLFDTVKNAASIYNAVQLLGNWSINFMEFANGWNWIQPMEIWRNPTQCSSGQYTILTGALAKTMLIPTTGLGTFSEDHTWNEFYDTKWINWDTGFGDMDANEINIIDSPGTYDPDPPNGHGGPGGSLGKQVSTVNVIRGDDGIYQSLQYTPYGTLNVLVTDKNDEAVDGAKILISPSSQGTDNPDRGTCIWGYTDSLGTAVFKVGNKLDYFIKSIHPVLGTFPEEEDQLAKAAINVRSGNTYEYSIKYSDSGESGLNVTEKNSHGSGTVKIASSFMVESERQWGVNEETKTYGLGIQYPFDTEGKSITSFICDSENFDSYLSGDHFEAYELISRKDQKDIIFESDQQSDWYLVLSNEYSYVTTKTVNVSIDIYFKARPVVDILSPQSGSLLAAENSFPVSGTVFTPNSLTSISYRIDHGEWQDIMEMYNEALGVFSFYWSPSSLDAGEHTLEVKIEDSVSDVDTDICSFFIDAAPPLVEISKPKNGSFLREGEKIELSGNLTDDIGPVSLFLDIGSTVAGGQVIITGEDITNTVSDDLFTYYFFTDELQMGEYLIELRAVDKVGHESFEKYFFYIDVEEPVITIIEPGVREIVGGPTPLQISGTASDDIGFASLELETSSGFRADLLPTLNGTNWKYDWNTSGLESEKYSISVSGIDGIGRWVKVSVIVEVDNDLPEIKIDSDYEQIIMGGNKIDFTGSTVDENELEKIEAVIIISTESQSIDDLNLGSNDTEWIDISDSGSGSDWLFHWDTADTATGNYIVAFRAFDEVGNSAVVTIEVFVDATDPILDCNMISVGELPVVTGAVIINGTALDNHKITSLDLSWKSNDWNSLLAKYDGFNWTYIWETASLDSGGYEIVIRAEDYAGRTSFLYIGIIVDNDPPEITINSNSKNTALKKGEALILTGKALDDNGLSLVTIRIDNGGWSTAYLNNGTGEWEFRYSTGEMIGGPHTATIKVEDIVGLESTKTIRFTIDEQENVGNIMRIGGIKWYFAVAAMAIILFTLLFILFFFVVKRRRKNTGKSEVDYFCALPKEPEKTENSGMDLFLPPLDDSLEDLPPVAIGSIEEQPTLSLKGLKEPSVDAGPVCTKCGETAEYLLEYDCFWCRGCNDYVTEDGSDGPDEKPKIDLQVKLPVHYRKKGTVGEKSSNIELRKDDDNGIEPEPSPTNKKSSDGNVIQKSLPLPDQPIPVTLMLPKLPSIGEMMVQAKADTDDLKVTESPRRISRKKLIKKL